MRNYSSDLLIIEINYIVERVLYPLNYVINIPLRKVRREVVYRQRKLAIYGLPVGGQYFSRSSDHPLLPLPARIWTSL